MLQPEEFWVLRSRPRGDDPSKCYWDKFALRMFPIKASRELEVEFPALQNRANIGFSVDQGEDGTLRPEHDEFDQEAITQAKKHDDHARSRYPPNQRRAARHEIAWF